MDCLAVSTNSVCGAAGFWFPAPWPLINFQWQQPNGDKLSWQQASLIAAPWERLQAVWEVGALHNLRHDSRTVDTRTFLALGGVPPRESGEETVQMGVRVGPLTSYPRVRLVIPIPANTLTGLRITFGESFPNASLYEALLCRGILQPAQPSHEHESIKWHPGSHRISKVTVKCGRPGRWGLLKSHIRAI